MSPDGKQCVKKWRLGPGLPYSQTGDTITHVHEVNSGNGRSGQEPTCQFHSAVSNRCLSLSSLAFLRLGSLFHRLWIHRLRWWGHGEVMMRIKWNYTVKPHHTDPLWGRAGAAESRCSGYLSCVLLSVWLSAIHVTSWLSYGICTIGTVTASIR